MVLSDPFNVRLPITGRDPFHLVPIYFSAMDSKRAFLYRTAQPKVKGRAVKKCERNKKLLAVCFLGGKEKFNDA